jgi:hypothetical protein
MLLLNFFACKSMSDSDGLDGEGGSSVMAAASDHQSNTFMRNMRIKGSKDRLMALFDEGEESGLRRNGGSIPISSKI